jgi:hypothetical protein
MIINVSAPDDYEADEHAANTANTGAAPTGNNRFDAGNAGRSSERR